MSQPYRQLFSYAQVGLAEAESNIEEIGKRLDGTKFEQEKILCLVLSCLINKVQQDLNEKIPRNIEDEDISSGPSD